MTESTAMTVTDEAVPALSRPRLPYHPALEERFSIDRGTWKVLTDVLFPSAEAPESIIMALSYCKARRLDIMKKPVHIVPVYDKKRGAMVDTVWPSINELRITAMRTGEYVGKDATTFGPLIQMKLGEVDMEFPEWAQTTVYRYVKGRPRAFVGERVLWLEYYAKVKRGVKTPNEMWQTKTQSQISKCSEASALRTAFPEELGNERTAEEMEGQEVDQIAPADLEISSGIAQRLNGQQDAPGFSQAAVHAEDGGKKRTRRTKAEMEAAQKAVEGEEVRPTGTASAPAADAGQDTSASAEPASEGSQDRTASGPETSDAEFEEVQDETGAANEGGDEDTLSEGYPAPDEVYMLEGDTWENGRRETYKNGLPFSTTDGRAGYAVYADHAPGEDGPLTAEEEERAEDEGGDDFPPEFKAYIEAVEKAADWVTVKKAMADFYNTALFKSWSLAQQNKVRASTWEILVENKIAVPDQAQDVSAFRLWIECQEDIDAIKGTFAVLQREPAYAGKEAAFKQAMEQNVTNRITAMRG